MSITHRGLVEGWLNGNELVWDEKHNHIQELQALIGNEGRVFEAPQSHILHILFNDNCKGDIDILTGNLIWIEQDRMEEQVNNTIPTGSIVPEEHPDPTIDYHSPTPYSYTKPDEDNVGEPPLRG
jgi:hypothetical protein